MLLPKSSETSLLLSTLLSNSEAWYNLTQSDISVLEKVDEELLRKIFHAHSKTPLELLYLESGSIPIRFILMSRRLNFLWYILNENEETLISKFFMAQVNKPVKGDWVSRVKLDLTELDLNQDFKEIKAKTKNEDAQHRANADVCTRCFKVLICQNRNRQRLVSPGRRLG